MGEKERDEGRKGGREEEKRQKRSLSGKLGQAHHVQSTYGDVRDVAQLIACLHACMEP